MTQADIMEYLDKNKGKLYSCKDLFIVFDGQITRENLYRSFIKIIKREEYFAKFKIINGKQTAYYGRK